MHRWEFCMVPLQRFVYVFLVFLPVLCHGLMRGAPVPPKGEKTSDDWRTDWGGTVDGQCEVQRQYEPWPSNCPQGNDRFSYAELEVSVLEFAQVWAKMKSTFWNPCCMGLNHRFAIFHSIRSIKPLVIIESGVAAGHTTWLIRQAAGPNVPMFSLDPDEPSVSYSKGHGLNFWKDTSGMTRYLTGNNFQDLAFARWDILIPDPQVRARTLVILDDHQNSLERLRMIHRWGFGYVFYEDNYPFSLATSADKFTCKSLTGLARTFTKRLYGDAYSPHTMCAAIPEGTSKVLAKDQFGSQCKFLTLAEHQKNINWMQSNVASYYEFPAVFSPCKNLTRPALLGDKPAVLQRYGFPSVELEMWHYGHLFPALIELKPLPASLVSEQAREAILATVGFRQQQLRLHEPLR